MVSENDIRQYVSQILREMASAPPGGASAPPVQGAPLGAGEGILPDIVEQDLSDVINVPNPHNPEALRAIKKITPARIGVGRTGTRYLTDTLLRFRADHAVAMDAVFTDVPE